ncbi:MAG TPA: hypothetical protein VGN23_13490 [Verrucomicrobiae bacterium]
MGEVYGLTPRDFPRRIPDALRRDMSTRQHNEKKFGKWEELPGSCRRYYLDAMGKSGWRARYFKEVDMHEATTKFWQEIYDGAGKLIEIHEKYPVDKGHKKV